MGDAADPREMRKTFIVPAIKPFDHYDFSRAKIACNLAWLVAKAFGTENVPEELREPFTQISMTRNTSNHLLLICFCRLNYTVVLGVSFSRVMLQNPFWAMML